MSLEIETRGGWNAVANWTDDRVEDLKRMWAEGMSASAVAVQMGGGVSRNAVIGKIHRLKLPGRVRRTELKVDCTDTPKRQKKISPRPRIVVQALPIAPLPGQKVGLLNLTNETCRYPLWSGNEQERFFCGSPQADLGHGRPYCPSHSNITCKTKEAA